MPPKLMQPRPIGPISIPANCLTRTRPPARFPPCPKNSTDALPKAKPLPSASDPRRSEPPERAHHGVPQAYRALPLPFPRPEHHGAPSARSGRAARHKTRPRNRSPRRGCPRPFPQPPYRQPEAIRNLHMARNSALGKYPRMVSKVSTPSSRESRRAASRISALPRRSRSESTFWLRNRGSIRWRRSTGWACPYRSHGSSRDCRATFP
mmetsp:Transcript_1243/g.2490  ORF Transcript_1243/g.2490 Transcript_1243/m.2490 type:complete len:208 (+) Transcript_1243:1146-1769(+)